jgi:hypothetical protein
MLDWITWNRAVPLGGKWGPLVGKVGEWYVESWHLQGCSPRLCRLRTDGLAPKSGMYWSHAGVMGPVSWCSCVTTWLKPLSPTPRLLWGRKNEVTQGWCSCVTTWLKPLSPTPRLLWGRKNEVTQGDGRASLSLLTKTSFRCRGLFCPCGD